MRQLRDTLATMSVAVNLVDRPAVVILLAVGLAVALHSGAVFPYFFSRHVYVSAEDGYGRYQLYSGPCTGAYVYKSLCRSLPDQIIETSFIKRACDTG